ncbi:MAG: hypothetical protein ABI679_02875 [Gemmatimonadota bacterium]
MRKVVLLFVLITAVGLAWYAGRRRYPANAIEVNGTAYEVSIYNRDCAGPRMCVAQVAFLTTAVDSAELVEKARGLLPWIENNVLEPGDHGVTLMAIRPGLLRLFPPREARGLMFGFLAKEIGSTWE